jgi:hypothetical protein
VVHFSLSGIWYCLRIFVLLVLWKLRCKYVFENEVSSLFAFCLLWREVVHMQLLVKGFFFMKDDKMLGSGAYSDFITVLVVLRKRM